MRRKNNLVAASLMGALAVASAGTAKAVVVTVDPATFTNGYMNVSNLPSAGGAYQFGQPWGFSALAASFTGNTLTLAPNTSIDHDVPADTYWWQDASGTSPGNKIMAASAYAESDALAGSPVTFTGLVTSDTLSSAYTEYAFVADFAPDYSSNVTQQFPITSAGAFLVTLPTTNAGDHIQYGFVTTGADARQATAAALGNVQVAPPAPVPEPATLGALALLATPAVLRRRRKA